MIKTHTVDLEKSEFLRYFNAIKTSLANKPLPPTDSSDYHAKLRDRLASIFDPEFIIIVSDALEYNIQTLKGTSWIFSIYSARVIVYKPKPIAFPQLLKADPITKEDFEKFVTGNTDPYVTSSKLIRNTLFPAEKAEDLVKLVKTTLNKLHEQADPISQMMVYAKQFCLYNLESIFVHIVVGNSETLEVSLPSKSGEEDDSNEAVFDFEFKCRGMKSKKRLFVFEKRGKSDSFGERFTNKWKEVLLVLAFIMVLLVVTRCTGGEGSIAGIELAPICRNRNLFVFVLAAMMVGFIAVRQMRRTQEKLAVLRAKKAG